METLYAWIVPALLVLVCTLLYLYGSWTHSTWSRVKVAGPRPLPLLGNMAELAQKGLFAALMDWQKKYGKSYGIYMFRRPTLMTSDPAVLREVFIKDFNNFNARGIPLPLLPQVLRRSVLWEEGDTWRRQRQTMTPTFSASKLKQMNGFISRCCTNLVNCIHKSHQENAPIDVKKVFGGFTLDAIAGLGFGLHTNCLEGEGEGKGGPFLDAVYSLVAAVNHFNLPKLLTSCFPALAPMMRRLGYDLGGGGELRQQYRVVLDTIHHAIHDRRQHAGNNGRVDVLQLLVDAETQEADIRADPDLKRLTTEEIVAQSLVFMLTGYETTSTALQYLGYLLAMNPDKQEKLHDAIVTGLGDKEPTYENVSEIAYLDSVIRETLRCFPPIPMFGRRAIETRTIQGVTIPAGSSVVAATYVLMKDEEFFPEPEKFIPERFDKEREGEVPPLVREMVFGAGPRQCIGMRLALYEIKMAAVAVIRKFRFLKIKETPEKISFGSRAMVLSSPATKILVGTQLRH